MKFSIIIPIYNGKETINECLDAILNQDYPKKDYELVIVNDGSTDNTLQVLHKKKMEFEKNGLTINIINFNKNRGRACAREAGAKNAKYTNLIFIDVRIILNNDCLKKSAEINYQPLLGTHERFDKYKDFFSTISYLINRKLFYPYFPQYLYAKELWIDEFNFDKTPKGLGDVVIDKKLFLSSIPKQKSKDSSDDTALLKNVVKQKKLLRHTDIKVKYLHRENFQEKIKHLFNRGPKFVDYYCKLNKIRFWLFIFLPTTTLIFLVTLLYVDLIYFLYWLGIIALILIIVSIWLAENIKDFLIIMFYLPIIGLIFEAGILKGLILKLMKRY